MMDIKAVVFDFDGTLYDKKGMARRVVLQNLRHLRMLAATRRVCTAFRGRYFGNRDALFAELFCQIAERAVVTPQEAEAWYYAHYLGTMLRMLQRHYRPRPQTEALIAALHAAGVRVMLYSDYGLCKERVEAIGMDASTFDKLYSSSEFGGLKPCKEAFEKMLAANGLSPAEVLLVGDSDICDAECAKRSGANFFSLKTDADMARLFAEMTT